MRSSESAPREPDARTRVLDTAYSLFSRHGIQAVGVDMGSIVSATRGDADAALRAGRIAKRLLETAPRN
jgi:hypothetical protein